MNFIRAFIITGRGEENVYNESESLRDARQ